MTVLIQYPDDQHRHDEYFSINILLDKKLERLINFQDKFLHTRCLLHIVGENPVCCRLCIGANQVVFAKIGHIEARYLLSACQSFITNLKQTQNSQNEL